MSPDQLEIYINAKRFILILIQCDNGIWHRATVIQTEYDNWLNHRGIELSDFCLALHSVNCNISFTQLHCLQMKNNYCSSVEGILDKILENNINQVSLHM